MIKAGIIGATGYAGNELVRILMGHKEVEIKWYGSRSYIDKKYAEVYQNMFEIVDDVCLDDNMDELASQVDVIFTATPQGFLAGVLTEDILNKVKIIDLSADFRIKEMCIRDRTNKYATSLMFLPLVELNSNLEFEGEIADSVTTEDNKNFIVHIDEKASWSDGEKITADDVVYTCLLYTSS